MTILMNMVLEFLYRAFEIKGAGWTILLVMSGITTFMVFAWIEHWTFRLIAAPGLFLAPIVTNEAMSALGLHITADNEINQAVGFGVGIVAVTMLIGASMWAYYELNAG